MATVTILLYPIMLFTNGKNPEIRKLPLDKSELKKPKEIKEFEEIVTNSPNFESVKSITTTRKPYGLATDAFDKYKASSGSVIKFLNDLSDKAYTYHSYSVQLTKSSFGLHTLSGYRQ